MKNNQSVNSFLLLSGLNPTYPGEIKCIPPVSAGAIIASYNSLFVSALCDISFLFLLMADNHLPKLSFLKNELCMFKLS